MSAWLYANNRPIPSMKLRCKSARPGRAKLESLGDTYFRRQGFAITVGKEYLCLGLFFLVRHPGSGTGVWVIFESDTGQFGQAPLALFEVVDPTLSRYWVFHAWEIASVRIIPPSFTDPFYMERFYEGSSRS